MQPVFRRIVTILILLAIVAGLAVAVRRAKHRMAAAPVWKPRPAPVETAAVVKGKLSRTIRYLARLEAVAAAEIAPKISARVVAIPVNEGDVVAAGDLLARLDDRDIRAQIAAIEAQIRAAAARQAGARAGAEAAGSGHAYALREYGRDRRLFEKKGISASALEGSRNRMDEALAKRTQAEEAVRSLEQEIASLNARLAEARARLTYAEIRADHPGTLRKRHAEAGDMAMPGKPLFEMMDVSSFRLGFDLVESDLARVHAGQEARIHWPAPVPEAHRTAAVSRIFPSLESDQTVRAEIDLPGGSPGQLKVGSLLPVEVVAGEGEGLILPRTALVPAREGGRMVYAVREGRLRSVPVEVLLEHEERVLVRGELSPGEPVAVGEYLQWVRLHDGMAVSS